ncbi:hypothetical protein BJ742DRAFT_793035 [Cladochytrium replicatum]|nr:hypothetical protein BJ742DRAFT_793035 [Cladochytrium replicatum]
MSVQAPRRLSRAWAPQTPPPSSPVLSESIRRVSFDSESSMSTSQNSTQPSPSTNLLNSTSNVHDSGGAIAAPQLSRGHNPDPLLDEELLDELEREVDEALQRSGDNDQFVDAEAGEESTYPADILFLDDAILDQPVAACSATPNDPDPRAFIKSDRPEIFRTEKGVMCIRYPIQRVALKEGGITASNGGNSWRVRRNAGEGPPHPPELQAVFGKSKIRTMGGLSSNGPHPHLLFGGLWSILPTKPDLHEREIMNTAASILSSDSLVYMHAISSNETPARTRLRMMRHIAGLNQDANDVSTPVTPVESRASEPEEPTVDAMWED